MQSISALSSEAGDAKPLSCVSCRQRKVKCSRVHPCPQCTRAGLECVFPARKRTRRPRANRQNELMSRLAKLEEIVGKVDPSALGSMQQAGGPPPRSEAPLPETVPPPPQALADEAREQEQQSGERPSPPKDDPATKYLGAEFWVNLCGEVHGLRQALDQPSDSEDEDEEVKDQSTPESVYDVSPAILGNDTSTDPKMLRHPPPEQIRQLCDIYFANVDLVLKFLHRPSILKIFDTVIDSQPHRSHDLDRATEAVLFAIYFAAVTSITPETCLETLGQDRNLLVTKFKLATEAALARADYLNNTRLESLQAFTLYVACLRSHNESRASWALLALVLRLSQAMGLLRDGDGAGFTPFEAEMRRRLWWQIVALDVRAVQDRGTEAMITNDMYNTRLPTNIDDADFGPEQNAAAPLAARPDHEGTDVTFALCSAVCSDLFLYLINPQSKFRKPDANAPAAPPGEDAMLRQIRALEARFVDGADQSHYPSAMAARVVRVVVLIFWLEMQYPFQVRQEPAQRAARAAAAAVPRELTLQTAVSVMELHRRALQEADFARRSRWWTETWVQWHPLAVALAELCAQTEGPLVDRAWRVIDEFLPRWTDKIADSKRGSLWRPIKKLLKKARMARAEAQMRRMNLGGDNALEEGAKPEAPAEEAGDATGTAGGFQAEVQDLESFPSLDDTVMSPPSFLFQDANFDFTQDLIGGQDPDLMDWSNWNEFVTEAYDDLAEPGAHPTPGSS